MTVDGLNECNCDAHKKKVGVALLYNTVHRKFNQLETRCVRESQHPAEESLRPPINQFGDQTSWGSDELERRCWIEEHVSERLGSQAPG